MMTAEYNKGIRRDIPKRRAGGDLRTAVEQEHSVERKLKLLARYAYLGSVDAERLPCYFRTIGDEIEVSANRGVVYDPLVQADRRMVLGCGAALMRLRVAIQYVGYVPIVRTFPNPLEADRLAVIRLGPRRTPNSSIEAMFDRIRMKDRTIAQSSERSEQHPVNQDDTGEINGPDGDRHATVEAVRLDARREGAILRAIRLADDAQPEEISDDDAETMDADTRLVIATSRDLTPDHLNAGQALERILLGAAGCTFTADTSTALLTDPGRRAAFRDVIGSWPQALLSRGE